jgi:predicted transcriptional regulator
MAQFIHPSKDEITLAGLLSAFADPVRLCIFRSLMIENGCMSCSEAAARQPIPKSTLSHHFRVMREAGLIRTTKQGVEHRNVIRKEDINERFPGLLEALFTFVNGEAARLK